MENAETKVKHNARRPANPVRVFDCNGMLDAQHLGLTKREEFAKSMMPTYLAQYHGSATAVQDAAEMAVDAADALLARLAK